MDIQNILNNFNNPIVLIGLFILLVLAFNHFKNQGPATGPRDPTVTPVRVPISLGGNFGNDRDLYAIFVGTGRGTNDKLMVEKNGEWYDIIDQTTLGCSMATYSAAAADVNNDGLTDLVVVREDGTTLYLNQSGGKFEARKISGANDPESTVTFSDYNKNGLVDILITQKNNGNVFLEGIGRGVFQDVTVVTRLDQTKGATAAKWQDVNGDQLPDLVLYGSDGDADVYLGNRGGSGGKFATGPMFVKNSDITLTGELNRIASRTEVLAKGGDFDQDAVVAGKVPGSGNWIGINLPDNHQFMNAIIQVVSVDQSTGKIHRQTKQNNDSSRGDSQNKYGKVFKIDLGNDDRVLHLKIQTIYDGTLWVHPNPIANKIMTFRDFKSTRNGGGE